MVDAFQAGQVDNQAALWRGSPESYVNLHAVVTGALGAAFTQSEVRGAYTADGNLYLVGSATDPVNHVTQAVMWSAAMVAIAPVIDSQPVSASGVSGQTITFSTQASGVATLSYQWQGSSDGVAWSNLSNDATYSGVTSSVLTIASAPITLHNHRYRVVISDGTNNTTSAVSTLTLEYTELWGIGTDYYGQLGQGRFGYVATPIKVQTGMEAVSARGAGWGSSLFLKSDGTLWASGLNNNGQLHDGTHLYRSSPVQVLSGVEQMSSSMWHTLFLKADNSLWGVGYNDSGQLGTGNRVYQSQPVLMASDVISFSAGYTYNLYVKSDGTLWAAGYSSFGAMGNGSLTGYATSPVQVATDVVKAYAGENHSLFIKSDGTLWGMGQNTYGELGIAETYAQTLPQFITSGVKAAAVGRYHSLFIKNDGTLWTVGYNLDGQLGDGSTTNRAVPAQIATDVAAVFAGRFNSFYIKTDGTLWACGRNSSGELGLGSLVSVSTFQQIDTGVVAGSAGATHLLYIKSNGDVWASGRFDFGEFGNGQTAYEPKPVLVADSVTTFAAGYHHSLFVKSDGTMWGMGENASGELGDGTTTARNQPVFIANGVTAVRGGPPFSLFLKTDGTLWGMGRSDLGQIGLGPTSPYLSPQQIDSGVSAIAKGEDAAHSLYIKTDGTLWGMGPAGIGQLGTAASGNQQLTPLQIASDVARAATGSSSSWYVGTDGVLRATGTNYYGQLGNGTTTNITTFTVISPPSGKTIAQVSAGGGHTLFLTGTGELLGAGDNSVGQLGQGAATDREINMVAIADDVTDLSAASQQSFFVKSDGTLWAMGNDIAFPLSATSAGFMATPTKIADDVSSVSSGVAFALFLKRGAPATPAIASQPSAASADVGNAATFEVTATGFPTPTYQWYHGADPIPGATKSTYSIAAAQLSDAGEYKVIASNALGSVDSETVSLAVNDPVVTVTVNIIAPNKTYNGSAQGVEGVETTPDGVTVSVTYDGSTDLPVGVGVYDVVATVTEAGYAGSANGTFEITQATQAITFATLADRPYSSTPITLAATADSDLTVSFTVVAGPATVSGNQLTLTGTGTVTVRASQEGDDSYLAATPVERSFTVTANSDSWSAGYFSSAELADTSISGPSADPDGDGLTNLLEYALGLNPKSSDTTGLPEAGSTTTDWTYTYTRPTDRDDLSYAVEVSTDLSSWTTSGVTLTQISSDGSTEVWQATYPLSSATNLFFRLKITQN